jgi:hypothetical protein
MNFELPNLLSRLDIDPFATQAGNVFITSISAYQMNSFVPTSEPISDKRTECLVCFIVTIKEGTDMSWATQLRTRQRDRPVAFLCHGVPSR